MMRVAEYPSEYGALHNAKRRCHDPEHTGWDNYGGRGITVCARWRAHGGFKAFLAHIGPKPTPFHTLDRFPDQNGNYEPGNVRWATPVEQSLNRRNNVYIEANGERLHINDWVQRTGLQYGTIRIRLFRGWPPGEAVDPHHTRTIRQPLPMLRAAE